MDKPHGHDLFSSYIDGTRIKSPFEVCKQEYFKALRTDKTESARRRMNSMNSLEETAQGAGVTPQPREATESVPKDAEKLNGGNQMKSPKPLIVPVLSLTFCKVNMNTIFRKVYLKLQPGKDQFTFELEAGEGDPRAAVARARIEIQFVDTATIGFTKEEDQITLEFKKFEMQKDTKKKMVPWAPCKIEELLASKEPVVLPEIKQCVLKIPKESFLKIHNPKTRITEKLRTFGVVVKENQRLLQKTGGKSENVVLPIKEILSTVELEEIRKREHTLTNADKKKKLEAFKQIELPKLSEANAKVKTCPVYSCFQPFPNTTALKTHISQNHKELDLNGIEIDNGGAISYPDHVFDSVLMALKIFPNFVSTYVLEEGKKLASSQEKNDPHGN
jgi:hypothetical protein